MIVVADTETNSLDNPDKIHVIVLREAENPEKYHVFENVHERFTSHNLKSFLDHVSCIVGHNWIGYDHRWLNLLADYNFPVENVIDTLVVSRLLNYNIEGGHSIEAWGERLGCKKIGLDITDWSEYTEDIKQRCIQDTLVNLKLYNYFLPYLTNPIFKSSLRTEHNIAYLCSLLKDEGFPFNKEEAKVVLKDIQDRLKVLDDELTAAFPPKTKLVREITPRVTKSGTLNRSDFRWLGSDDLTPFVAGAPFSVFEWEEFNPASPKQIVERLNEAGWRPTDKTKGHIEALKNRDVETERLDHFRKYGWKVSEENLRTLPDSAPEAARKLTERLLLAGRASDIEEWLNLATDDPDGITRIHGNFNGIGAWTHRMSTNGPNMQNIPVPQHKDNPSRVDQIGDELADKMRAFFHAPKGKRLIGTDADGIQMRIFAHYVNDERLINALINGKKEDGTDIHSVHWRALGPPCKGRNPAKTFIYAWLLGAGIARVAEILECSSGEANEARENFLNFYPGLSSLKKDKIPADARRGYFSGLDGRLIVCNNEHLMLGGYLQSGESIIMKRACLQWRSELTKRKLPFWQVNFVHDEWQTLSYDDDELCQEIAQIQQQAIVDQGTQLGLNCPLAANSKFGYSWAKTH